MSKSQLVNRVTIVPNVRVCVGRTQPVRFIVHPHSLVIRTRGLPRITITESADHKFIAKSKASPEFAGILAFEVEAKTPQAAFVKGAKEFWQTPALM